MSKLSKNLCMLTGFRSVRLDLCDSFYGKCNCVIISKFLCTWKPVFAIYDYRYEYFTDRDAIASVYHIVC